MRYQIVTIGASWGGLGALRILLGGLLSTFPLPIVIAQHRSADAGDASLAAYYGARCRLPVCRIEDKQPIEQGHVYLAPPDYHVLVERGHLELSADVRVQFSRPSIDVLFETAADAYGSAVVGVVLTGVNADGAAGLAEIKRAGGHTVVQDPSSSERADMPLAAIAAVGQPDLVTALEEIPAYLAKLAGETDG